jgi:hypothetical protein
MKTAGILRIWPGNPLFLTGCGIRFKSVRRDDVKTAAL